MTDPWTEGYRAAVNGATYDDNPHQEPKATAWAFGCSEGMKERNSRALDALMEELAT
jgi:ribosome modulation factor